MRERNAKKGKRKGGETRERGKDEKEKRRTAYLEREKKKEKIYKREKKKRERFFLSYFRMTNLANSSKISNSPLSRGTPAVRRCLAACFPLAPLPLACVLFAACFARLSQKEKFSFFEIFSSQVASPSALLRYAHSPSLIARLARLYSASSLSLRSRRGLSQESIAHALSRRSYVWTRFCN